MPDGMGHEADSVLFAISTLLIGNYGDKRLVCVIFHCQDTIPSIRYHPTFEHSLITLKGDYVNLLFGFLSIYQGQIPGVIFKMAAGAINIELNVVRTPGFSELRSISFNILPEDPISVFRRRSHL